MSFSCGTSRKQGYILFILCGRRSQKSKAYPKISEAILENILADLRGQPPRVLGFVAALLPAFTCASREAREAILAECVKLAPECMALEPMHAEFVRYLVARHNGDSVAMRDHLEFVSVVGGAEAAFAADRWFSRHAAGLGALAPLDVHMGRACALPIDRRSRASLPWSELDSWIQRAVGDPAGSPGRAGTKRPDDRELFDCAI